MNKIQEICTEEGISISEAIQKLNMGQCKILLVTKQGKLKGIVTDGDIRRWVLKQGSFDLDISELMCKKPRSIYEDQICEARNIMLNENIDAIPVLNKENEPVDIIFIRDLVKDKIHNLKKINIPVVIMAGGKGSRLKPYTDILPKPLIPIGEKTIIERIMESFQKNGCNLFYLTINYKKSLIKAYFEDNKNRSIEIKYVEEKDFYGTCGSIHMLKNQIQGTFFLSNCDVLLDIDYAELLEFHKQNCNEITAVTSLKHFQIPYGIFEIQEGGRVYKMVEKPEYNYQVNAGIYALEPSVLKEIPEGKVYHMTDLINQLIAQNRRVGAYPVTENCWQDMGELQEMEKMIKSF